MSDAPLREALPSALPAAAVLALVDALRAAGELTRLDQPREYWAAPGGLGFGECIVQRAIVLGAAIVTARDADGRARRIRLAADAIAAPIVQRLEQQHAEANGAPLRI